MATTRLVKFDEAHDVSTPIILAARWHVVDFLWLAG